MKFVTSHLLKFTLVSIILTFIFRFCLSYAITHQNNILISIFAISYGIGMFFNGFYFGKKERNFLPIFDIGFRFHLMTYLAHIICSYIWFILEFNSKCETIQVLNSTAIQWGIFLLIHFLIYLYLKNKSIKGLRKEDIFE